MSDLSHHKDAVAKPGTQQVVMIESVSRGRTATALYSYDGLVFITKFQDGLSRKDENSMVILEATNEGCPQQCPCGRLVWKVVESE